MARAGSASVVSAALMLAACADPAQLAPKPHLDFGLPSDDLSVSTQPNDLGTANDLAMMVMANDDLAHSPSHDMAMTPSPDLRKVDLEPMICDDAGTSGHLFLAAVANANALVSSSFTEANGWQSYQTTTLPNVTDLAQVLALGRPLVVARQSDTNLGATAADPCTQIFPSLAPIASNLTTAMRPALSGGSEIDLVFRGNSTNDTNLYLMTKSGLAWAGPTKLTNMTTTTPFTAVRANGALHVLYSDGGALKDGLAQASGDGGPTAQIGSLTTAQTPVAVIDKSGSLQLVFVGTDTNLYWVSLPAGGSWSAAHSLCEGQTGCLIDTHLPISIALDDSGTATVAWVGIDTKQVYTTQLVSPSASPWFSTAAAASGSCGTRDCQTTVGPALSTGVGSAHAELVFVSDLDGRARHSRLTTAWSEPTSISGTNLLNTPALTTDQ